MFEVVECFWCHGFTLTAPFRGPFAIVPDAWCKWSFVIHSVLVQEDGHLLGLIRYVERNPLRANLVKKLDNWRFSSYWRRKHGTNDQKGVLADWPIDIPDDYDAYIHEPMTIEELEGIRNVVQRGRLYGSENWTDRMQT